MDLGRTEASHHQAGEDQHHRHHQQQCPENAHHQRFRPGRCHRAGIPNDGAHPRGDRHGHQEQARVEGAMNTSTLSKAAMSIISHRRAPYGTSTTAAQANAGSRVNTAAPGPYASTREDSVPCGTLVASGLCPSGLRRKKLTTTAARTPRRPLHPTAPLPGCARRPGSANPVRCGLPRRRAWLTQCRQDPFRITPWARASSIWSRTSCRIDSLSGRGTSAKAP